MKRIIVIISLLIACCAATAQDNGITLKPNYRKIARVVKSPASPYFLDSLEARFDRCDTTLTVDHLRCLYFASGDKNLSNAYRVYKLRSGRFGRQAAQVNTVWTQYQMLTTAVWSTGDGTKRKPLHVVSREDAETAAMGYDTPLWFKIKGKRKFSVAPRQ